MQACGFHCDKMLRDFDLMQETSRRTVLHSEMPLVFSSVKEEFYNQFSICQGLVARECFVAVMYLAVTDSQ
jgi:hypothetical protein